MRLRTPFWVPILAAVALHGSGFLANADKYLGPIGQIIAAIDKSVGAVVDFKKTLPPPVKSPQKATHQ
jgi:hypothetical protein